MSTFPPEAGLTISAVAARTGLTVAVLRAWEQRHGFPQPARLDGGHRRYDEGDVARIQRVVAERARGRSLEAAIALVGGEPVTLDADLEPTLHGGLRHHRPDLAVHVLSRRSMLAVSYAIEDESLSLADRPHLIAGFQRVSAYRQARRRWDRLAQLGGSTVVLADFVRSRTRDGVHEVRVARSSPLAQEWFVVCDAPRSGAVLSGLERPDGRFEAVWSVEPSAVRLATRLGRRLAGAQAPDLDLPAGSLPDADVTESAERATALTNRIVAYLDTLPV